MGSRDDTGEGEILIGSIWTPQCLKTQRPASSTTPENKPNSKQRRLAGRVRQFSTRSERVVVTPQCSHLGKLLLCISHCLSFHPVSVSHAASMKPVQINPLITRTTNSAVFTRECGIRSSLTMARHKVLCNAIPHAYTPIVALFAHGEL